MRSSPAVLAGCQLALLSRKDIAVTGAVGKDLLEALGQVPDPGTPRGRRYEQVPVLAIAVCAVLGGARSHAAITEYAVGGPPALRAAGGLCAVRGLATIWRVLTTVDPAAPDRAIGATRRHRLRVAARHRKALSSGSRDPTTFGAARMPLISDGPRPVPDRHL